MAPSRTPALRLASLALLGAAAARAQDCTTWYETATHGPAFRNVKDAAWGAKGDGVTDDTNAIVAALTTGRSPNFSTKTPGIIYLPPGTYVVTKTLPLWFLTHLVGNSKCPPTLLVPAGTYPSGQTFVLAGDTSYDGDHDDEFYRAVMHINIKILGNNAGACGIHWAVSQATWLRDMTIDMGPTGKYGIFDENGSGGFASDLTIIGGQTGLFVGNQQWTWLNINVTGSTQACINQNWDWISAWVGLTLSNCPIGIQFAGNADGSILVIDTTATNVPVLVEAAPQVHVFLERVLTNNVQTIVSGATGLPGSAGTLTTPAWRQGPSYAQAGTLQPGASGPLTLTRPDAPLERRKRPTFDGDPTPPVNAVDFGAKGDGVSDDTAAIQKALNTAGAPAVFLPQGVYLISSTLTVPAGGALVGELNSILLAQAGAPAFANAANPSPLLLVPASSAGVRLVDIMFAMNGDVPGCIFLEWQASSAAPSGLWDVEWRVYNTASDLFLVHGAGAGAYFEEGWGWVADHDIDGGGPLTVKSPRGMTITGTGAGQSWLYGTAMEHSSDYQYNFSNARGITTVVTQTETDYWSMPPTGWAMVHENAQVQMYGSGWYNWFNGNQTALFTATNSTGNSYCINVHGTNNVQVGDVAIPAYTPIEEDWFCDGFAALSP